ncbi:MAG TPA: glycosyltransferase family 39 protein [Acidimicrobiales bacterium]|nr:glycosyltransferase family 39 protein [Acidimicrobiales bacterium]
MDGAPPRRGSRWLGPLALFAIVGFGAWTRAPGFTSSSLWFDDAWSAMPARVGLGTAIHMVTTAPGYTIALRSWLQLHPGATWWAQLPAFVAGLAGIVAVFFVLRYFGAWWPLTYLGALVVAASPVAVDYSTRVKQFGLDLLLACLVLWLFERWRRAGRPRDAALCAAACAGSLLVSLTTLVVCVAVAGVAALLATRDATRRRDGAVVVLTTIGTAAIGYVLWLRHLSPSLHYGWTKRGYLLSTASLHRAGFSLEAMGTGLFHWMLGTPLGRGRVSTAITAAGVALALLAAVALVAITAPPLVGVVRRRGRAPGALVASSLAVVLAVILALLAKSPFGGGRTDEVLYPSILLLAAGALSPLAARAGATARRAALAGCVVVAAVLVGVGATHRASYPTTDLRPLVAQLDAPPNVGRSAVVVVDPWLAFSWAYDGLTPTSVSFAPTLLAWSQGFHVVSRDPDVVISENYFFPDRSYPRLSSRTTRVWYVASTVGHQSRVPGHPNDLEKTANYLYLRQLGWAPAGVYLTAPHTEAVLLVYRPSPRDRLSVRR